MKRPFYDLNVAGDQPDGLLWALDAFGWDGACIMSAGGSGSATGQACSTGKHLHAITGTLIAPKGPDSVQRMARSALEAGADLIFVSGGDEEINRAASECWEVDVICHPERVPEKDALDQKNSGIDDVMARLMAERGIAIEICLAELLSCRGPSRAQVIGRMKQNIRLARKYKTPIIITSGAKDAYGLRTPHDLHSLALSLGMDRQMASAALSSYPQMLIKKSQDRRNPNLLLTGLEVISWGFAEANRSKKMFGWY